MGTRIVNLFPKNHLYKTKEDFKQFAYYCDARFIYIERYFCLCTQISWHKWCTHYYESSSFYVPFFFVWNTNVRFSNKIPECATSGCHTTMDRSQRRSEKRGKKNLHTDCLLLLAHIKRCSTKVMGLKINLCKSKRCPKRWK